MTTAFSFNLNANGYPLSSTFNLEPNGVLAGSFGEDGSSFVGYFDSSAKYFRFVRQTTRGDLTTVQYYYLVPIADIWTNQEVNVSGWFYALIGTGASPDNVQFTVSGTVANRGGR